MRETASRRLETNKFSPEFRFLLECLQILCCAGVIAMTLLKFVVAPVTIYGISMEPSLHDGQRGIYHPYSDIQEGDVVVFRYNSYNLVKRVLADEYDILSMKDGVLTVYDHETGVTRRLLLGGNDIPRTVIKKGTFWVVGDKLNYSNDSRKIGAIPEENVLGEVIFVWDGELEYVGPAPAHYMELPFAKYISNPQIHEDDADDAEQQPSVQPLPPLSQN